MATLKDIQRLLLQNDLLMLGKIFGQLGVGVVFHASDIVRQCLRNKVRSGRAFQTVRRKLLELRIIRRMKASMRNQENFVAPRRVRQLADVGQKFLRSGNVKLAARQHKIGLHIHFPKNVVARLHGTLRRIDAGNTIPSPLAKPIQVARRSFICILAATEFVAISRPEGNHGSRRTIEIRATNQARHPQHRSPA